MPILDERQARLDSTILQDSDKTIVKGKEKTGLQVHAVQGGPLSDRVLPRKATQRLADYQVYREMRLDPTIALARWMAIYPSVSAGWSIEATDKAPKGAQELIQGMLDPLREDFVYQALAGCCDYGFAPFEKIFDMDDEGHVVVKKLKPLMQTITEILVCDKTGAFQGFRQDERYMYKQVNLELENALLVNVEMEGTDWYGMPMMAKARAPYERGLSVAVVARRYDEKMAGAHWVIHYPPGSAPFNGQEDMDNEQIARLLLLSLVSNGAIAVPTTLKKWADRDDVSENDMEAWKIELVSASGQGSDVFISREKYIDSQKVRALGWPERAVTEGQYGTKAESESHADLAITSMEMRYACVCRHMSQHVVNQVLDLNYGRQFRNSVFVAASPLSDDTRAFMEKLYLQMASGAEAENIDTEQVRDQLGIPTKSEEEKAADKAEAQANMPPGLQPGGPGDPNAPPQPGQPPGQFAGQPGKFAAGDPDAPVAV